MNHAGIYISIPFCRQKCTYCNFASDVHPSVLMPSYVDSVTKEIAGRAELWNKPKIPCPDIPADTDYMGRGTPGLLSAEQMKRLLDVVRQSCSVEPGSEIT